MTIRRSNPRKQGDIGVAKALDWFVRNEYAVSIPFSDSQHYDLVVEKNGILSRVQVKTTTYKTPYGIYQVLLKTCGGNQSRHTTQPFDLSVELLFCLTDEGDSYLTPAETLKGTSTLNLGLQREKYKV